MKGSRGVAEPHTLTSLLLSTVRVRATDCFEIVKEIASSTFWKGSLKKFIISSYSHFLMLQFRLMSYYYFQFCNFFIAELVHDSLFPRNFFFFIILFFVLVTRGIFFQIIWYSKYRIKYSSNVMWYESTLTRFRFNSIPIFIAILLTSWYSF